MKGFTAFLIVIAAFSFVFAADDNQVLEFKSKIGFTNGEDKIIEHEFFDGDRKLLIIGEKNLQIWEVGSGKLINSVAHQIPQFAPRGFVSTYLLLSIPKILDWRPFAVDPQGKWIITAEKVGTNPLRSAVVRDLRDLKQIALMTVPNVSIDYVIYNEAGNEILTQGKTDRTTAFAGWNAADFSLKQQILIDEYKWHQPIYGGEKIIVGSGDTKILWKGLNMKEGSNLTRRDVKTGAVEMEYTAENLKPKTAYQETTVSADEKHLISKRDDRIFVWEIAGDGSPKYEISNPNPKGNFSFKRIVDKRFIVVKIDEQLRIYDIENSDGAPQITVARQSSKEDIDFVQIFSDRFAVVRINEKIRIYDLQNGKEPQLEIVSDNPKDSAEFYGATKEGRYIVVRDDRKVSVYELSKSAKPLYEIARTSEKERFPMVRLIEDKNLLAVARVNRAEKKEPRTEFYEIPTGKLAFDASFEAGYGLKFTPDGKYIYQTELGAFAVWNTVARKFYSIKLKYYSPSSTDSNMAYNYGNDAPYNTEYAAFSPDYRYILRYDGDVTAVYDTETGDQRQTIFDSERVKYDKKNQIKSSGLDGGGWLNNGRYVYAFDSGGLFSSGKTVSFWEVKK